MQHLTVPQSAASVVRLSKPCVHLSLSLSDHHRPAHSSSAPALLVASLPLAPAAAHSAQHRYCSCRLIFTRPCFVVAFAFALCVCTCVVAIQIPALGGCSACSGRYCRPLARPELLSGLIAQLLLCLCHASCHACVSIRAHHSRASQEQCGEPL